MLGLAALASLVMGAAATAGLEEAIALGDSHFARRAEGAKGGTAVPAQVDAAIREYRRALALDMSSSEARVRLLRAFYFKAGFCDIPPEALEPLFEEAKKLADDTVKRLQSRAREPRGRARREAALLRDPLAPEIYLWAAASWGQWAVKHLLAAAWQGTARQIRDLSQAVVEIEPTTLFGGAYLILGRLNCEAPRIPMLTGWVSHDKGIAYLRQAVAVAPEYPGNLYFLADALLTFQPDKREEATALLKRCLSLKPRPEYLVEDLHYAEQAAARLADLR